MNYLEAAVRSLLNELGLPEKEILALSAGNPAASLPYHNNEHNYVLALNAYEFGKSLELQDYHLKHLVVAGIFHDYDHTGGTEPDVNNILRAIKFVDAHDDVFLSSGLQPWYLKQLIQSTQNPPRSRYSLVEQIMRDADMMSWCEPGTDKLLEGLSAELNTKITINSTKEFFKNLTIFTAEAQHKLIQAGWLKENQ